ncbi:MULTISPECIES: sodium:calcium antiporter [Halorussus]|uniref:sodium:calcium antiporter n=1 Tax=Halorussus TaxID=1070314 RepID=UPI0020A0D53D|nr:sodium:calcium antiporter [Halorussus vallis]USZ76647.1 sodium:calcium antiporter [Halorussus vallis]
MAPSNLVAGSPILSAVVFLVGVALVVWSVEEFVERVAATSVGLGVSTFFLTVVLAGTDVENVILGSAAVFGDLPGVGLGTVFGEAVFILCAAVGLGGVLVPFEIETPTRYLALTAVSPAVLLALSADGVLSRTDGAVLVLAFLPAVWLMYRWERAGGGYLEPDDEIREELRERSDGEIVARDGDADGDVVEDEGADEDEDAVDDDEDDRPLVRLGVLLATIAGMTLGSELAVQGTRGLLAVTDISGLAFGATVLSFVASLEEILLTVEPVRNGRPAVAAGNVVGSMVFFVTANAGALALIRPLRLAPSAWTLQYPFLLVALGAVLVMLYRGRVTRPNGLVLLGAYGLYWVANYV